VEDSPNGIHSAYSAGCKVFMVPDLTQPDAELEKFIYKKVESLVALKEYF
jgi:beta-phosphoglucomutase-like phosphatase (HAD superfamily)